MPLAQWLPVKLVGLVQSQLARLLLVHHVRIYTHMRLEMGPADKINHRHRMYTTQPAATYRGTKKKNTTTSIPTLPMPLSSNLFVKALCQLMRRMRSA